MSEDAKELVTLCRSGRLYDIEKWIAAGKPLDVPVAKNGRSKTLLRIAVETGFHSLVELIAKHETNQASKNAALADSVSLRRLDFAELLVDNGAEITSVPLYDVLLTWEPRLMRFFLDRGADPIADSPFATAFGAKVRTAIRAFIEYKQARPDLAPAFLEQANMALRYFCSKGEMKWISLMLWAGADARAMGPSLDETDPTDRDCYVSAMQQACYSGNIDVLKKLKPEGGRPPYWTPRDTLTGAQSLLVIMTSNQEMTLPPKAADGRPSRSNLRFSSSRMFSLSATGLDNHLEISSLM
ncbi:MAG: hypothetical protein WA424_09590 [Candidatus Sulfotelmatobacter sp.]